MEEITLLYREKVCSNDCGSFIMMLSNPLKTNDGTGILKGYIKSGPTPIYQASLKCYFFQYVIVYDVNQLVNNIPINECDISCNICDSCVVKYIDARYSYLKKLIDNIIAPT